MGTAVFKVLPYALTWRLQRVIGASSANLRRETAVCDALRYLHRWTTFFTISIGLAGGPIT